jgi:hypothetical protein
MPRLNSIRLAGDMARGLEAGMRRAAGCVGRGFHPGRPLLAGFGPTTVGAEALHMCGEPRCIGSAMPAESARSRGKRGMSGCFAGGVLARAGWRP